MPRSKPIVVVTGPTAVGKTNLGLTLAKMFAGELLSADSRQVYKHLTIGTGKDIDTTKFVKGTPKLHQNSSYSLGYYSLKNIPLWLVDIVEPDQPFTVADYVFCARAVIADLESRSKLPLIVGGTGFYIKSLLFGLDTIGIPPDPALRSTLAKLSPADLRKHLGILAPEKLKRLNNSDRNNSRRLIRAIEVARWQIKNYPARNSAIPLGVDHQVLTLGLTASPRQLQESICARAAKRLKQGLLAEITALLRRGIRWTDPAMDALGYRQWQEYFTGRLSVEESMSRWIIAEYQYAKRQLTYLKKLPNILWYDNSKPDTNKLVALRVTAFLAKCSRSTTSATK